MAADPPLIALNQARLAFGERPLFADLALSLSRGERACLVGRNGSGKSTLLKLVSMAIRQTSGRIVLFGRDTAAIARDELPAIRRKVGIVFQDFRLMPHLSAFDNVALPLRIAGIEDKRIGRNVTELLDWVGLGDLIDAPPSRLSGGQQQRVAIARAVIGRPRLLLADEPTGNVDDAIAMRLLYLFAELNKLGTTILVATHNERLAKRFSHPRLHLADGRVHLSDAAA